jgi:hypothetical protein
MFKKGADGVTKQGKTKGKNLGDSGPSVGIQAGAKGSKGKMGGGKTNEQMMKLGRNMAKVANQGMMRKSAGRGR